MKYQSFNFQGKLIRGFYYDNKSADVVLMFHGFTGNKVDHHFMMKTFCEDIARTGFNVYRFDFLGSGDSDGTFYEEERITSQIKQGEMLVDYYLSRGYQVHLFAFSMGGVVATHVTNGKQIKSMFLLSPAGNFDEILTEMLKLGKPCGNDYQLNGFHIHQDFIKEALCFPYFKNISCECPVKIVQGSKDQYVSKNSLKQYQKIYKQCDCTEIEDADHCYSTLEYTQAVRKEIVSFYGKIKNLAIKE